VKYIWITVIPMVFVGITTLTAGIMNIKGIYIPQIHNPSGRVTGIIDLSLTLIIMFCVVSILIDAMPAWFRAVKASRLQFPGRG